MTRLIVTALSFGAAGMIVGWAACSLMVIAKESDQWEGQK